MVFIKAFGAYLPARVVDNAEMAGIADAHPDWIFNVSGIDQRRFAAADESVADLAFRAAETCLANAGVGAASLGMLIVASGSAERQFPGPAATVAGRLGMAGAPALDLPMASAGTLFGLALASRLAAIHGDVLVVGAEKMSSIIQRPPINQHIAVLFGDGAGACLVSPNDGPLEIIDSAIHSDGLFAEELRMNPDGTLAMNGKMVIMQAARKLPRVISELLTKNGLRADEVQAFLMHQANRNLIVKVAETLGVNQDRFYSNIRQYGNTSSASMLIAAAEWSQKCDIRAGQPVIFAAFGAGFHWGALLAMGTSGN
jgi:3-oxoacyl-[acyl-carrier-protein] synthase-3